MFSHVRRWGAFGGCGAAVAALLVALTLAGPAAARDRNDHPLRERRHEREELAEFLLYQRLLHQDAVAQQIATYRYLQILGQRNALRGTVVPSPWWPSRTVGVDIRASAGTAFRESPGERELEIANLFLESDPKSARDWLHKAIDKAGDKSDIAELARRQLKAIEDKQ